MSGAVKPSTPRAGAAFEVEQVEVDDGRLFVSGWWSGVRGMRFVRPTLVVGDRQVLATLEHKPWAPGGEDPWCAAFPWESDKVDLDDVTLVVAPSITVPLGSRSAQSQKAKRAEPRPQPTAEERPAPAPPATDPELTRLRARVTDLETTLSLERRATQDAIGERDAAVQARLAAERERDHALAQRDEATAERDAAVRTRERMESNRDEALRLRESVETQRATAEAERDEARAQRDEVLLAHRTLERQLPAWRAGDEPVPEAGPDEPAGVRAIPATRTIAAHLHRAQRAGEPRVSQGDLWAIRIFGTIAAICFILLLVMILRAFL